LAPQSQICTSTVGSLALISIRTNPILEIIHGDIKPENILIFKDDAGAYIAKVTDFGYSTQFACEDDFIPVPKSWPWCAPEHNREKFKPAQARKMDVFSFGMLCLWVLFEKYLSWITSLPQDVHWAERYFQGKERRHLSKNILEDLKQGDQLAMLAQHLVLAERDISSDKRQALERFFRTSLACNPDERDASLEKSFSQLRLDQ
jgi:serine/threonine protein kinase